MRPSEISIDRAYQEAWLLLAVGDSAAATELLDLSLNALPLLGTGLLEFVAQAAGLVRAMALRAELAARAGDNVTAQRWTRPVIALWSDADPELRPVVDRIHEFVAPTAR